MKISHNSFSEIAERHHFERARLARLPGSLDDEVEPAHWQVIRAVGFDVPLDDGRKGNSVDVVAHDPLLQATNNRPGPGTAVSLERAL